jgi:type II secretory pathway predicted ATPase ExeA
MYTEFYALTGRPFQLSPSPNFFYASRAHRRAVAYFTFGLQQGEGFIVITGEVGTGKTTLVGYLREQLSDERLFVALVSALSLRADDVPRLVAQALALDAAAAASKASVLGLIERDLGARHDRQQRVLLVVDEAQNLARGALETLHALSSLDREGRAVVQILLLGQPQFRDTLASPALERLRQRVVASAHLGPLEPDEVRPYLEHRLRRVGWAGRPALEPALFGEIQAFSRGLPRLINLLAARLLVHGAIERRPTLTAADARELARELERENLLPPGGRLERPAAEAAPEAGGERRQPEQRSEDLLRREVERLQGKLEALQDDLGRERGRLDGARDEADRLRDELRRLEVERLRVDAETTRRLAELLSEANGRRRGLLRRLF